MYRKRPNIFDLINEFRREMDDMFSELDDFTTHKQMHDLSKRELYPLVQIMETEDSVVLAVDLPTVRKEDIRVNANEDSVRIEARTAACVKMTVGVSNQREAEFDCFKKTVNLPTSVDPTRASASFKEGILRLSFPKKVAGSEVRID